MITKDPTKIFMRPCDKCSKIFRPSTRQSRVCDKCKKKIRKIVVEMRKNGKK